MSTADSSARLVQTALPRSLLACLPCLWSQVLFPASSADRQPFSWRAFAILLILPAVLLYPCMSFYLFEPDEGRYAEIPREMLERGEWIVPYLQGEPYLDKPPLLYWLVMLSFSILGPHDWSARLVCALAAHGTVLLTYGFGRRSVGNGAAFWGALALALAPGFLGVARLLILDGVLTFLVALALFAGYEALRTPRRHWRWWLLSACACGLAVLTKGPVAVILVLPPLCMYRWLGKGRGAEIRNPKSEIRNKHEARSGNQSPVSNFVFRTCFGFRISNFGFMPYLAIVLLIALPWFIAISIRLPEFAHYFLWEHNVVRFLFPFAHRQPIWFYAPVIAIGLLPVTTLLWPFLRFLFSGAEKNVLQRTGELGFMLLAGGWCVLFFSLSTCKLATYVLPAYPFLCLAFGVYMAGSRWAYSPWTFAGGVATFVVLAIGNHVIVPWAACVRSPMNNEQVRSYCGDSRVPVVCYPRNLDSVAFYLRRDDLRNYRSKYTPELLDFLKRQPKTVVLFSHRHSLEQLQNLLPPELQLVRPAKLGLCDMAVVQMKQNQDVMAD